MITNEKMYDVVAEVLEELFEIPKDELSLETNLYTDLDLDSLDAIDLASTLSSKAKIKLVEEEMKAIRTVGDIVELGLQKLN